MDSLWRAKMAVKSAAKGWFCVGFLLVLLFSIASLRTEQHISLVDELSILLIWTVSTGVVTFAATVFLIVPYVWLVGVDPVLRRPWRMYVEPAILVVFASFVLTYFVKPYAATFWRTLSPFLTFALLVSLASSVFYMRSVKAVSNRNLAPGQGEPVR